MKYVWVIFFLGNLLLFPSVVNSKLGVGVGTGKIQIDEKLKPGMIYELPSLSVINTGDVASDYAVGVGYHQNQEDLKPPKDWFEFFPLNFYLEPGEVQVVTINLNLPLKVEPGNYFVYLEGSPTKISDQGSASVGVAAAAKLYFSVEPANFLQGIYYKLASWWKVYSPWPQRMVALVVLASVFVISKRFFNINVGLKKPKKGTVEIKSKEEKKDG